MKRYSEVVLNGHPDKFCDVVADRLILEAYQIDPESYGQIEVAVWSDHVFLTGAVVTRRARDFSTREVIQQAGLDIGYTPDNYIDVHRYHIHDHVCWLTEDPRKWTHFSNDQSIVVGYAGYDALTNHLPPEHHLCWYLREHLVKALSEGSLQGHGPDGKILIIMQEEGEEWMVDTILATLQQKESTSFLEFTALVEEILRNAYRTLQQHDTRWCTEWGAIKRLINPNGPLLNGGSDGDNGQTGRKLVMDFYGPRIPIGGGALYGKDLSHIDRVGALSARRFAVEMLHQGAKEALVKVCYAPGMEVPLSVDLISGKRPFADPYQYFSFSEMRKDILLSDMNYSLDKLGTFYNPALSFNRMGSGLVLT